MAAPGTHVISEDPYIIQSSESPDALCYLYVPKNKHTSVVVDCLGSLTQMAKWKLWETEPAPIPPAFEIKEIQGKGLGMVAIRDISPGELLVIERPVYSQSSLVSKLHSSQWSDIHLGSLEGLSDDSKKQYTRSKIVEPVQRLAVTAYTFRRSQS